ncbi:MAG TPA: sulfotransferase family 2 domain-containing protein [Pyrinomonadaceae bacterium]
MDTAAPEFMNKHPDGNIETEDKALLFLHIPKAAGTTLHSVIERQFAPSVTFTISGAGSPQGIKEFISLPPEQRERIRLLKGHMPYGLHKYLSVPATYITMLRDPVDRVISHYYFARKNPAHYLHQEVTSKKMTLADFVGSGLSTELTNDQTRLISGVEKVNTRLLDGTERRTLRADPEPVTREMLEIAKRNLREHFAAVGLFGSFDESLLLFKKVLGWTNVYYVRLNVTKDRPAKRQVPGEERALIERYNELDLELYEYARLRFEEAIRAEGAGFQHELRSFQRKNRLYETALKGYARTREVIPKMIGAVRKKGAGEG